MEEKKHKTIFVSPRSNKNRLELNPTVIADPNPLPAYTYGTASNETFPQTFPTVRKEGVGVAADVSTPTFAGSEGEGKEIDFFKVKDKINNVIKKQLESEVDIEKSKIYLSPGEKPPKGVQIYRGKRGGYFYIGKLPGRLFEKKGVADQYWERPGKRTHSLGGVTIPKVWEKDSIYMNSDPTGKIQLTGIHMVTKKSTFLPLAKPKGQVDEAKWKRVLGHLEKNEAKVISKLDKAKGKNDEALIIKIQSLTAFRIGSEDEPQGKVRSYGVSTLLAQHVKVNGDKVTIRFPGKDGVINHRTIVEPDFAKRISKIKNPNKPIFNTDYEKVSAYLRTLGPYRTHDFRSLRATQLAMKEVKKYKMPTTEKELGEIKRSVGKTVGAYLFNGYSIALSSYICPALWIPLEANVMKHSGGKKAVKKSSDGDYNYFDSIQEMDESVQYVEPSIPPAEEDTEAEEKDVKDTNDIKGEIDGLIEKAKIYLGRNDPLPHGKKLQFGPKGGRFYETELEVYRHFWERLRERKVNEQKIQNAINYLETKSLPTSDWWYEIKGVGTIVGHSNQVQTVLDPRMAPRGYPIDANE